MFDHARTGTPQGRPRWVPPAFRRLGASNLMPAWGASGGPLPQRTPLGFSRADKAARAVAAGWIESFRPLTLISLGLTVSARQAQRQLPLLSLPGLTERS